MARPRNEKLRNKILNSFWESFQKEGYKSTSYGNIAAKLDTTKALIQYHYPKKEQLAISFMERLLNETTNILHIESAAERNAAEQSAAKRSAAERNAAERNAAERSAAEQIAAKRSAAERNAAEQSAAKRSAAERNAAERSAAERNAAERNAAEQSAAERTNAFVDLYRLGQVYFTFLLQENGYRLFLFDVISSRDLTETVLAFNVSWALEFTGYDAINEPEQSEVNKVNRSVIVHMGGFYELLYHCLKNEQPFDVEAELYDVLEAFICALGYDRDQAIDLLASGAMNDSDLEAAVASLNGHLLFQ